MTEILNTKEYINFLNDIKKDIQTSRVKAALSVNKELILLYWRIGKGILSRQKELGWGAKVVDQLSLDLKHEFPETKGFSRQNLFYMRQFAGEYSDDQIIQQLVGQLPWGHNIEIFTHVKDYDLRKWYIEKTIENGWSRNVLVMQIESSAHLRLGNAQTNFELTLPKPTSDMAKELIKSEYNFEFLGLSDEAHERDIEKGLIDHIRKFLLELGCGFAFLGSQYKLEVGGEDFYIDLLFYNLKLRSYFLLELKSDKFKPEYAGKLSFYITAVNRLLKQEGDNPTIGLLLCKKANKIVVEYALDDFRHPIGVSEYTTGLPENYQKLLPTKEQFQHLLETLETETKEE